MPPQTQTGEIFA